MKFVPRHASSLLLWSSISCDGRRSSRLRSNLPLFLSRSFVPRGNNGGVVVHRFGGVPRGGGCSSTGGNAGDDNDSDMITKQAEEALEHIFGAEDNNKHSDRDKLNRAENNATGKTTGTTTTSTVYPGMTGREIEKALNSIPVYCVTLASDRTAAAVVEDPDDGSLCFYLFFNRSMAVDHMELLKKESSRRCAFENDNKNNCDNLQLRAFKLGFVWYNRAMFTAMGGARRVKFHMVPYDEDLLYAGVDGAGSRQFNPSSSSERPFFSGIPVFHDQYMRLVVDGRIRLFPLYFSALDMRERFSDERHGAFLWLDDLIETMQRDSSNFNWRDAMFIPHPKSMNDFLDNQE